MLGKKKEQLQKRLEAIEKKVEETFAKMLETSADEDVKKYEMLKDQADAIQEEIENIEALEEKETLDKGGVPGEIQKGMKNGTLSESEKFCKKIVEAVSLGTTFTGTMPREMASMVQKKKENLARIRGLCTIHQATGDYTVMVEGADVTVDYVDEAAAIGETSPTIEPLSLSAIKLAAIVKVSREYIEDLAVDVMAYITDKLARGFAKKEDFEILFGGGSALGQKKRMRGIITRVTPAKTVNAASETAITWEEVKRTIMALGPYQGTAHLVMNQSTCNEISLFKDEKGDYLFPQNERLTQIMGIPIVITDVIPAMATGGTAIVAGDFSYYHIMDRETLETTVLTERYADTDQVGIRTVERIDGDCVGDAFAVLYMKAASGVDSQSTGK